MIIDSFEEFLQIYTNLSKILQGSSNLKDIITLVLEKIPDEENDLQLECLKGLSNIINNEVKRWDDKIFFQILDKSIHITIFRKILTLLLISNQNLQQELTNLFRAVMNVIHYEFIEKECEKHVLFLSDKSQQKTNKISAARMIAFISEVKAND